MTTNRRDNPYYRLLLASILTCWISGLCLAIDLYPGSPFGVDWHLFRDPSIFIIALLLFIPAGLFALFILWPSVLVAVWGVRKIEQAVARKYDWAVWIGSGVIAGPPAMFVYSFPLGLGRALLADLMLTGVCCGALCAALARWLIGPEVDDMSVTIKAETADRTA